MKKEWKNLPTDCDDCGDSLSAVDMVLGLASIVAEWLTVDNRDESVRDHEMPLLIRIQANWDKGVFSDEYIESLKVLLANFVRCGDNEAAVKIACEILGKSPEELEAGSMAAAQVLTEIENFEKE